MTSVATPAAPTKGADELPPVSVAGLVTAVVLLIGSAVPAIPALWATTLLEPATEYPGLAIVFYCLIVGGSLYFCGAIAAMLTLWPARRGLGHMLLVAAVLPWVAVGVTSLPFLVEVCSRNGGACG